MMNLPYPEILSEARRVGWLPIFGLATAALWCLVVLFANRPDLEPVEGAHKWAVAAAVIATILLVLTGLQRLLDGIWSSGAGLYKWYRKKPPSTRCLMRRFARLDLTQRGLLSLQFHRGRREFYLDGGPAQTRWFEELVEQGFVQTNGLIVFSDGGKQCTIPVHVWQALEHLNRKGWLTRLS